VALNASTAHAVNPVFIMQFLGLMSQPAGAMNCGPDQYLLERKSAAIVL